MESIQIELLRQCHACIDRSLSRVLDVLGPEETLQGEELYLFLGLRLGRETMQSVILLQQNELHAAAAAVARGFIEASIRLRWASLESLGWERLVAGLAAEQIKWSKKFAEHHQIDHSRFPVLQEPDILQLVRDRSMPPDIAAMLDRIFELEPIKPQSASSRELYYGIFWLLHSAAHGSPALLSHYPAGNPARDLDVFLSLATQLIISAAECLTGESFRDESRACLVATHVRMQKESEQGVG